MSTLAAEILVYLPPSPHLDDIRRPHLMSMIYDL
jgi:hypothetical protein